MSPSVAGPKHSHCDHEHQLKSLLENLRRADVNTSDMHPPSSIHGDLQFSDINLDSSWRISYDEKVNDLKNELSKLRA
jgi:hypothetical protein